MKEITLASGNTAVVDDDDFEMLSEFKWSETKPGHRRSTYARTNVKDADGKYYTERMHRIVMRLKRGDGLVVDHINGNGLDNRKMNLRVVTPSENAVNVAISRGNSSGYKGVSFRKNRSVWLSEIRKNYKTAYRGHSRCVHLAALKYNDNAIRIHGESAWLNNIKECSCDECTAYKRNRSTG